VEPLAAISGDTGPQATAAALLHPGARVSRKRRHWPGDNRSRGVLV